MKKNILPITDPIIRRNSIKTFNHLVYKEMIRTLTRASYSTSSELAMASDWNRFVSFCEAKHVQPLPASITGVRLFLEHEAKTRKWATLKRYTVSISNIHQWHGFSSPSNHRQIKFTLQQLRSLKHGDAEQASPMTKRHLDQLEKLLKGNPTPRNIRDLSIFMLMFECALKRSELKTLTLDNLLNTGNKITVQLDSQSYLLSKSASAALEKWKRFLSGSTGYLYRRIDKHNNIGMEKLDDSSIYRILRRASDLLELPYQHRFTGQSARVGSAKELESQGYKLKDIQDFGRWLSPAMPAQYLERTSIAEGEKAKFKSIRPWD